MGPWKAGCAELLMGHRRPATRAMGTTPIQWRSGISWRSAGRPVNRFETVGPMAFRGRRCFKIGRGERKVPHGPDPITAEVDGRVHPENESPIWSLRPCLTVLGRARRGRAECIRPWNWAVGVAWVPRGKVHVEAADSGTLMEPRPFRVALCDTKRPKQLAKPGVTRTLARGT